MKTKDIRNKFLEFFKSKGHTIVESDSVVPKNDPTVLFTTAGMQQFKRQFLGHIEGYTKATTSQKCIRTDDLDEVGQTNFHHTFFEMLGNFSFGDYFKEDAIKWAWEFLTQELGIKEEKLWVSVYKDDKEAENIWLNTIKFPKEKLVKLGDKSNFWPSNAKENGPNGPCGPCSEIFYDYGVGPNAEGKDMDPGNDTVGRFSEIWNLVFTQFNRLDGGQLEPLPSKNIDTGMGLERLAAVLQGKKSNFEIDLFEPILNSIDSLVAKNLENKQRYIIADHIRAVVFGINDGVVPSNEGRGYIMKKLIIDSSDIAQNAGVTKPVIYKLVDSVVEAMSDPYEEIAKKARDIAGLVNRVEESYIKVRKERIPELQKKAREFTANPTQVKELIEALGQLIFVYRDTFGLTLTTIENSLIETGIDKKLLSKATVRYNELMEHQQNQSREASNIATDVFVGMQIDLDIPKTEFLGYSQTESKGKVLKIFVDGKEAQSAKKGENINIILNKSCFYAESGGQVGDTGIINNENLAVRVIDTQKQDDRILHAGVVEEGTINEGDQVECKIEKTRRAEIMRHHTATHILQWALRTVLGEHVQQQGSLVDENRLRFDFTHHSPISHEQINKIEDAINSHVLNCDIVKKDVLPIEKARKLGALSFFAEKYGDTVRVVTIGDYSKEFCGGTHLDSTGEIGIFKIVNESAIAQGIRRIEARVGQSAFNYINKQTETLTSIASALKAPVEEVSQRIGKQTKRIKQLEKTIEQLQFNNIKSSIESIIEKSPTVNGIKIITHDFSDIDMGTLRKISDLIKQKVKSSIVVLGAQMSDNASILVTVTDDLVKKDIKANELINEIAPLIGGSGGGRAQMAQAGSKEAKKIPSAISKSKEIIEKRLNT